MTAGLKTDRLIRVCQRLSMKKVWTFVYRVLIDVGQAISLAPSTNGDVGTGRASVMGWSHRPARAGQDS